MMGNNSEWFILDIDGEGNVTRRQELRFGKSTVPYLPARILSGHLHVTGDNGRLVVQGLHSCGSEAEASRQLRVYWRLAREVPVPVRGHSTEMRIDDFTERLFTAARSN